MKKEEIAQIIFSKFAKSAYQINEPAISGKDYRSYRLWQKDLEAVSEEIAELIN